MDREQALDKLYGVALSEFTATRNELAKELGGGEGVKLKALKKPNLAAWAINQLARRHKRDLDDLLEATEKLRNVQRRVLSGGKASELRRATEQRTGVVSKLTKLAEKILRDAGHAATAPTLAAIRDSLVAVGASGEGAELVRKGRLERELESGAFPDVSGLTLVPSIEEAQDEGERDARQVQRARTAVGEAQGRLRDAKDALKKATAEANKLRAEADESERKAKAAREAAEFAQRAADARQQDVDDAQAKVREAEKALKAAERER